MEYENTPSEVHYFRASMHEVFSIRKAEVNDIDALIDINIRVWQSTYRGSIADEVLDAMTPDSLRNKWQATITNPESMDRSCFVATSDGSVVGYVICGKSNGDLPAFEWVMYAIYILEEHQGKGLGKRLFDHALKEMQARGVASFMLFVLKDNLRARHFYEALKPGSQAEHIIEIGGKPYTAIAYGWPELPL